MIHQPCHALFIACFLSSFLPNSSYSKPIQFTEFVTETTNFSQFRCSYKNMYGNSVARGGFFPATESIFPSSNPQLLANPPLKDDSILSYYNEDVVDFPLSKKRPREPTTLIAHSNDLIHLPNGKVTGWCGTVAGDPESVYFLGKDCSGPMMQQQFEIDQLIFLHTERVKIEMEEQRRKQANRTIRAIEEALSKKMRVKDEQIEKMSKFNMALQERVRSLYLENQLWRDLAQSNEATANALRSSLDQLLAQFNNNNNNNNNNNEAGEDADAESCRGSSGHAAEDEVGGGGQAARSGGVEERLRRMCRRCGGAESRVLVLPCRHLCLCIACGPTVDTCPICNSTTTASVHVNFS